MSDRMDTAQKDREPSLLLYNLGLASLFAGVTLVWLYILCRAAAFCFDYLGSAGSFCLDYSGRVAAFCLDYLGSHDLKDWAPFALGAAAIAFGISSLWRLHSHRTTNTHPEIA